MKRAVRFVPCFLTFLRVAMTPVLTVLMLRGMFAYAAVLFAVICLTDLLDGFTARRLHSCTAFGAYFDVFADLFYILSSLLALNFIKLAPFWFTAAVVFKFIEFALTSAIMKKKTGNEPTWVFDGPGRCFSAAVFLSPGIFCLAALYQVGVQPIVFLYLLPTCTLAAISSAGRITRCVIKFENDGIKRGMVKSRPRVYLIKEG